MTTADAEEARGRSRLYGLLATIFWSEPDESLLWQLATGEVRALFEGADIRMPAALADGADRAREGEALALEFTRLFMGPGKHIAPYGSVQLDSGRGNLWGEATAWVQAYFDRAGFSLPEGNGGIPDHFALELLFLQHVTGAEADALERGAEEEAAALREVRQYFLHQHLLRWAEPFLERVEGAAETDFYPAFCALARRLLASEAEAIDDTPQEEPGEWR